MSVETAQRFRISDAPNALPGKCAVCGYAASGDTNQPLDHRKYVDFGLDIDYYGTVYFCTDCVNELAKQLGYLLPEDADEIAAENVALHSELARLSVGLNAINSVADALTGAGWIIPGIDGNITEGESVTEEAASDGSTADSEPTESVDESGPDDVRDPSDLLI